MSEREAAERTEGMDGDDQACSTQRAAVPDLAAGTLPMEAGSSTVPGPMTGMEIDGGAVQLPQAEVFSDDRHLVLVGGRAWCVASVHAGGFSDCS